MQARWRLDHLRHGGIPENDMPDLPATRDGPPSPYNANEAPHRSAGCCGEPMKKIKPELMAKIEARALHDRLTWAFGAQHKTMRFIDAFQHWDRTRGHLFQIPMWVAEQSPEVIMAA